MSNQNTAFKAELRLKPKDEIRALHELDVAQEEQGRFFDQPSAGADFDHWSKISYWTLDEAIALLLGKAPEVVSWESIRPYLQV